MIRLIYDKSEPRKNAGYWDCRTRKIGVAFEHPTAPLTFAHELAHAKLGHTGTKWFANVELAEQEYAAWSYVREHKWAFSYTEAYRCFALVVLNNPSIRGMELLVRATTTWK